MKHLSTIISGCVIITATVAYLTSRSQTSQETSTSISDPTSSNLTPTAGPAPSTFTNRITWLDPDTFQVKSPDGNPDTVAALNTPELIQQRADSAWAFTDPAGYLAQHPLTPEQLEAGRRAGLAMMNPNASARILTPAELEAEQKALEAIANPGSY
jgi:hypothetical protein